MEEEEEEEEEEQEEEKKKRLERRGGKSEWEWKGGNGRNEKRKSIIGEGNIKIR